MAAVGVSDTSVTPIVTLARARTDRLIPLANAQISTLDGAARAQISLLRTHVASLAAKLPSPLTALLALQGRLGTLQGKILLSLEDLGMTPSALSWFRDVIDRPNGIFLVTGPTGSGKTTTLYAALQTLNRADRKILTVEDPVEYRIKGINQVQVAPRIGLDFARVLKAFLRQAPNVVLVGEIRDKETAEVAIQASLTGHLVFSTVHTNDAPSAATRLLDMGVPPFLVATSLQGVLAQRLVRVLDDDTKVPYEARDYECQTLKLDPEDTPSLYRPGADDASGFRGRTGIYELIAIDDAMRTMIHDGASEQSLEKYARTLTPSIRDDGRRRDEDEEHAHRRRRRRHRRRQGQRGRGRAGRLQRGRPPAVRERAGHGEREGDGTYRDTREGACSGRAATRG